MALSPSMPAATEPPPSVSASEHFRRIAQEAGARDIDDSPGVRFDDVIIAVHGIGAQSRNSTVRSVANRLAQSDTLRCGEPEPFSPQPLGYFHAEKPDAVRVVPLDRLKPNAAMARIGFTEVYWADIPQEVVLDGRTLEETKAWAHTVSARARRIFQTHQLRHSSAARLRSDEPDFSLASEVLDEMVDTIRVLQHLSVLAEKAGMEKFALDQVLTEYLGDVQLVTEFEIYRRKIVARFHDTLAQVRERHPNASLHIVAHSEGTVISFLGLLEALQHRDEKEYAWVNSVRGFMTLGSPLDKHLLLWPDLFDCFRFKPSPADHPKIKWRNYYDYGDPVGFKLDTTRRWLKESGCDAFDFNPEDDYGFARYLLPGKAHNDYWSDPAVFEHFVFHVIRPKPTPTQRDAGFGTAWWLRMTKHPGPHSRPATFFLSPALPYILSALVLFLGVVLFYKAVSEHVDPPLDPLHNFVRYMTMGVGPKESQTSGMLFLKALGLAALLAGTTLLARWRRLTRDRRWSLAGFAAFGIGALAYAALPTESRDTIGIAFTLWPDSTVALIILLSGAIGLAGISLLKTAPARYATAAASVAAAAASLYLWQSPAVMTPFLANSAPEVHLLASVVLAAFVLPWCRTGARDAMIECQRPRYWPAVLGLLLFAAASHAYFHWLPSSVSESTHLLIDRLYEPATFGTLASSLLVALIGMTAMSPPRKGMQYKGGRRTRWFRRGMRPLLACGAIGLAALVLTQMFHRPPSVTELELAQMTKRFINDPAISLHDTAVPAVQNAQAKAANIRTLVQLQPPIWPVILAGIAFLYLWWLAALLFDLSFIWQHYIRQGAGIERLVHWKYPPKPPPNPPAA